jgi:hypothetical protein
MRWDNLKHSVFADAVAAELASTGNLGLPDLPCLKDANQILISSPALLAIVTGSFPTATSRQQTSAAHMQPATYKNITLWISRGRILSVAQLSDQLVIIGLRKTLESAIDRFEETREGAGIDRHYSPLLARAARYTSKDLWVVATQLPDPLASLFVPIVNESRNFDGSLSLQNGLHLEATLEAASDNAAQIIGESLRGSVTFLPAVAHDLQVRVDAQRVLLALEVSPEQLVSGLRETSTPPTTSAPLPVPETVEPKVAGPQIIRIFGLDEGTREIVLTPTKPQQF